MIDLTSGQPHTAHTTNPVPFTLIINDGQKYSLRADGILADIAPTVLYEANGCIFCGYNAEPLTSQSFATI